MDQSPPVIYLLYGNDEFAIAQFIKEIESKLGDADIAAMNTTRLDGRNTNTAELLAAASAMPFLAQRRIVILQYPTVNISSKEAQKKFTGILEQIPETTGLILVEDTSERDKVKKIQWLLKWAAEDSKRNLVKEFGLPKSYQMQGWIQAKARSLGASFTPAAAAELASLLGNDTRLATQEIEKLLAFVNYQRTIDVDDVEMITADTAQADIFALVDAISAQQSRQAMSLLEKLKDQQDAMMILAMVQRQFRLLLQAREVLDGGGDEREITKQLKLHPFVSGKLNNQARRFNLLELEMVYRRLLDLDEGIKTGQIVADLALDTFVAAFTNQ
jgi:DNA polymerase-3 subunit delta